MKKAPAALSSTALESPGKTIHESQNPLSPQAEKYDRTVRPVVCAHSSSFSEWNIDETWSSQEWKSDELMEDRTVRPVVNAQHTDRFIIENDETTSYTEAESELSLGSRSFLHRVNDQVRKMQQKTATTWGRITLLRQFTFHQKYRKRSHMKQMFDISEKLISEQSDEISGVKTINWKTLHGSICL